MAETPARPAPELHTETGVLAAEVVALEARVVSLLQDIATRDELLAVALAQNAEFRRVLARRDERIHALLDDLRELRALCVTSQPEAAA